MIPIVNTLYAPFNINWGDCPVYLHDYLRFENEEVSQIDENFSIDDPNFLYEGSCEEYEDPADYIRLKAVRL